MSTPNPLRDYRAYAGVGSRETPAEALKHIERMAHILALKGYTLRSGAAPGADAAWERGAIAGGGQCEIFLPWGGFQGHRTGLALDRMPGHRKAMQLASEAHPAWDRLSPAVRKLMARNAMQVLGADCNSPARVLICWARNSKLDAAGRVVDVAGGTGLAVRIAARFDVRVINLAYPPHTEQLAGMLQLMPV